MTLADRNLHIKSTHEGEESVFICRSPACQMQMPPVFFTEAERNRHEELFHPILQKLEDSMQEAEEEKFLTLVPSMNLKVSN